MVGNFLRFLITWVLTGFERCLGKVRSSSYHLSWLWLIVFGISLSACQSLPKVAHLQSHDSQQHHQNPPPSSSYTPPYSSLLADTYAYAQAHPQLSGYFPITTGSDAFAVRHYLTTQAVSTIDVQYYIWHNDEAGRLMLQSLWQAAERGVLVRFLLDDSNGKPDLDRVLLQFASHPNIAVRIVNPASHRHVRFANFITHPKRSNVRMHNKSMTFDHQFSIVGGRNVGDEYFGDSNPNFVDLDVLLTGEIVPHISQSFENYWQSNLAYDIETLVQPTAQNSTIQNSTTQSSTTQHSNTPLNSPNFIPDFFIDTQKTVALTQKLYVHADFSQWFWQYSPQTTSNHHSSPLNFAWAKVEFVADDASKLHGTATGDKLLVNQLRSIFGTPKERFSIISSYFVPTADGVKGLQTLSQNGVKINILTNAYTATDVKMVHSYYAPWRKKLLKSGIGLYEVKANAPQKGQNPNSSDNTSDNISHNISQSSLHAKAIAVDDIGVFIGSYNVDPRSANINSELGVVIYDKYLANKFHQSFDDKLLNYTYKLAIDNNQLLWQTLDDGQLRTYNQEPKLKAYDYAIIYAPSVLPLDWLF